MTLTNSSNPVVTSWRGKNNITVKYWNYTLTSLCWWYLMLSTNEITLQCMLLTPLRKGRFSLMHQGRQLQSCFYWPSKRLTLDSILDRHPSRDDWLEWMSCVACLAVKQKLFGMLKFPTCKYTVFNWKYKLLVLKPQQPSSHQSLCQL